MASKRRLREKQCGDKRKYWDEAKANADRYPDRMDLQAYRCKFCHRFHLGHPTKAARISRAAKAKERRKRS
jgi:hypothetical protein